jgi:hypothetical protein
MFSPASQNYEMIENQRHLEDFYHPHDLAMPMSPSEKETNDPMIDFYMNKIAEIQSRVKVVEPPVLTRS